MTTLAKDGERVRELEQRLLAEYGARVEVAEISRRVAEALAAFDGAPIRTFVPILAERRVREALRRRAAGTD